ncbi:hypothetical protein [Legionella gresilensis]|uniref:hypothetical protein n=1 Tax=Legionella gresilensis TaxID=91823 RepID=UPI0010416FC1|nr:hypothetical protein [Legionella gresilensis]
MTATLFKPVKSKSPSMEELGNELREIDIREQVFFANVNDKLKAYADLCAKDKQIRLETIKKNLEHEKEQRQQTSKSEYKETFKNKQLTESQQIKHESILQQKLKRYEDIAIRKYEQFSKQCEEQFEEEKKLFLKEQQHVFDEKIAKNNNKRDSVKASLRLLVNSGQATRVKNFKLELNEKVKALDAEIEKSLRLVNNDSSKALDEYKRIDIYLYNTLNNLAQKHLYATRNELKLSLAIKLSELTKYNLQASLELSEKIVKSLSIQITSKDKNKISFELIAKNIEKELGLSPQENNFEKILLAIKSECLKFTARTEYLFTSYYDAKKREYGNKISSDASDVLIDQDNACRLLQEQVLNYMLKNVNPTEFHSTFVNLGIEELRIKMSNDVTGERIQAFARHKTEVLEQLSDRLNELYDNFFIEKRISPVVKEKLNRSEVQKFFYERITQKYMKHKQDDIYNLGTVKLSASEVLAELEGELEKQLSMLPNPILQMNEPSTIGLCGQVC